MTQYVCDRCGAIENPRETHPAFWELRAVQDNRPRNSIQDRLGHRSDAFEDLVMRCRCGGVYRERGW